MLRYLRGGKGELFRSLSHPHHQVDQLLFDLLIKSSKSALESNSTGDFLFLRWAGSLREEFESLLKVGQLNTGWLKESKCSQCTHSHHLEHLSPPAVLANLLLISRLPSIHSLCFHSRKWERVRLSTCCCLTRLHQLLSGFCLVKTLLLYQTLSLAFAFAVISPNICIKWCGVRIHLLPQADPSSESFSQSPLNCKYLWTKPLHWLSKHLSLFIWNFSLCLCACVVCVCDQPKHNKSKLKKTSIQGACNITAHICLCLFVCKSTVHQLTVIICLFLFNLLYGTSTRSIINCFPALLTLGKFSSFLAFSFIKWIIFHCTLLTKIDKFYYSWRRRHYRLRFCKYNYTYKNIYFILFYSLNFFSSSAHLNY